MAGFRVVTEPLQQDEDGFWKPGAQPVL